MQTAAAAAAAALWVHVNDLSASTWAKCSGKWANLLEFQLLGDGHTHTRVEQKVKKFNCEHKSCHTADAHAISCSCHRATAKSQCQLKGKWHRVPLWSMSIKPQEQTPAGSQGLSSSLKPFRSNKFTEWYSKISCNWRRYLLSENMKRNLELKV